VGEYIDTDKVFTGFTKSCVAAPDNCALASDNVTATDLETTIYGLIQDLKANPFVLGETIIDYNLVTKDILSILYQPSQWPELATGLHAILTKNATEAAPLLSLALDTSTLVVYEYLAGIACGDKSSRASKIDQILPEVAEIYRESHFGDLGTDTISKCAHWKLDAKERYSGNFQAKTRNPIMIIGNTYDPITPLDSAFNISKGFEGSVVLQHDGYGVRSKYMPFVCLVH
jgi:hypothetical protein